MLEGWIVVAVALGYIGLLFVIASYGDRTRGARPGRARLFIYPLSLAIYCTSWTFFGSVGLASRNGFDFLTIYIGPMLVIGLLWPVVLRIVRLAKAQNITSIADFIAARYGKGQAVAATVALIAIVGCIPYIALQLKAVSSSLTTILGPIQQPVLGDLSLLVALAMAAFAVLFGTRHTDATEHQDGLMFAIAAESIVKLIAFLAVGAFVTFVMFNGPADLFARAMATPQIAAVLTREPQIGTLLTMTALASFAILLLPRQFHVTVVENYAEGEIKRAAWLFPLYLLLINLFVVPIALAGMLILPRGGVEPDMFVLALPMAAGSELLTLVAFIGGLSAATAMVIVECVALAIMVSNDIVMPLVLKRREALIEGSANVGALLLRIRRIAIFVILFLAYVYYRSAGTAELASIGLLSFAAIAQLAPAFFGGLLWRRATARGAIAGMVAGIIAWTYTLLLPSIGAFAPDVIAHGPWGFVPLRPQNLLWVDVSPLMHGVMWSLAVNVIAYVAFSLTREPTSIERLQASTFAPSELTPMTPAFRLWRSAVAVEDLKATVARYIGEERTRSSFESFAAAHRISLEAKQEADIRLLRYAEHLLASAIGAASSRLVLSLLLRKRTVSTKAALKLLDDASAAIHYNREILQTALDHVSEGIAVFDSEQQLICWNRQFGDVLDLPPALVRVGTPLDEIVRATTTAEFRNHEGVEEVVHARIALHRSGAGSFLTRFADRGLVVEVRPNRMPDGGIVATYTDITPSVVAAESLERANETLERRVHERTEELTHLNAELARAKSEAEDANLSKTRFLAAASHDILQPLNAARLYVTSLVEREGEGENGRLASNIDASLEAVEDILGALLDISRLDTGVMRAETTTFPLDEMLRQLEVEFTPLAREKGLDLIFVPTSLSVRSDRRLLRRMLQNLISNAVKYTVQGRVLVGCRRRKRKLRIEICDTGLGVPSAKRRAIFKEFHRLDQGAKIARGLGLGLSIVERIGKVLDHKIDLESAPGRGSRFWVEVPIGTATPATRRKIEQLPADGGRLHEMVVLCIDNEPEILRGLETLLGGWGCTVLTAADLKAAAALLRQPNRTPHGLLVDYHLDEGNGMDAIIQLRWRHGVDLPAILITADRSPQVRAEAAARGVQVLNKPVKPAALRALLAQWRVQRIAAAE